MVYSFSSTVCQTVDCRRLYGLVRKALTEASDTSQSLPSLTPLIRPSLSNILMYVSLTPLICAAQVTLIISSIRIVFPPLITPARLLRNGARGPPKIQ